MFQCAHKLFQFIDRHEQYRLPVTIRQLFQSFSDTHGHSKEKGSNPLLCSSYPIILYGPDPLHQGCGI